MLHRLVSDEANIFVDPSGRKPSKWITSFHHSNNADQALGRHTLSPAQAAPRGAHHESRAQRPSSIRARRGRRKLFASRRAPRSAQIHGLATSGGPRATVGRAAPVADDPQAHRDGLRGRGARACTSRRRRRGRCGITRPEPADRAKRPPEGDHAKRHGQHRPGAAAGRVRPQVHGDHARARPLCAFRRSHRRELRRRHPHG